VFQGAPFQLRIVGRPADAEGFVLLPQRRVVERTHSWMNRFRGTLIRWCKKAENYIALLHMSLAFIIYRRMELIG
jgi:transposase